MILSMLAAPLSYDALIHALSSRDPVACSALDAPVETWLEVVHSDEGPPWVPLRAAGCLLEGHAELVEEELATWLVDPESQGLGMLVLAHLDRLPAELSLRLAREALAEGPDRERASRKIAASERAELRALVRR